jgi:hypothetical protein
MEILGYFIDENVSEPSPSDVFVALKYGDGSHACYSPVGQHGGLDLSYLKGCTIITVSEYRQHAGALYTPADYLR